MVKLCPITVGSFIHWLLINGLNGMWRVVGGFNHTYSLALRQPEKYILRQLWQCQSINCWSLKCVLRHFFIFRHPRALAIAYVYRRSIKQCQSTHFKLWHCFYPPRVEGFKTLQYIMGPIWTDCLYCNPNVFFFFFNDATSQGRSLFYWALSML